MDTCNNGLPDMEKVLGETMTDYSKMDDKELNEAIAKEKGWQAECFFQNHSGQKGYVVRIKSKTNEVLDWCAFDQPKSDDDIWKLFIVSYGLLDYCHDWRLCGELLEDLLRNGEHLYFDMTKKKYGIGGELDDSALTAICKRWLAWKEVE